MRRSISLILALAAAVIWTYGGMNGALALDESRLKAAFLRAVSTAPQERFSAWLDLQSNSRSLTDSAKLARVNDFVNRRIRFAEDQEVWRQSDYWATPMETLAKSAGDCEDFAIFKFYTLRALGIPAQQLRLIYVRARVGGASSSVFQAHMVLAYYPRPDADPLVLDNLVGSIYPASRRPDLLPVFSFNTQGIFHQSVAASTTTDRLSRWQDLIQRADNEGLDQ